MASICLGLNELILVQFVLTLIFRDWPRYCMHWLFPGICRPNDLVNTWIDTLATDIPRWLIDPHVRLDWSHIVS